MTTYGDATTTDSTLASLCEQSIAGWELVVQTTGSTEAGGSHPWLLFLDSGDTLHPGMLARIRGALAANPTLDAVHCGWSLVDDARQTVAEERCDADGDLFDLLACRPAFPSCACVVRRTVLEAAGGFDLTMGVAADWVLWQRIARRGARFGRIRDALVSRRALADRGASPAEEVVASLRAIALGHGVDRGARVAGSAHYASGRLVSPDSAEVNAVCAAAARELAIGGDAARLVELLPAGRRAVDADAAAAEIVRGAPLALARRSTWWTEQWDERRESLGAFLEALEQRIMRPGAARAIAARMQRRVLPHLGTTLPSAVAGTWLGSVDAAAPIEDLVVGAASESVQLRVQLEGDALGTIELTPIERRVSAHAIRAAVAEQWADRVLTRYLKRHPEAPSLSTALWIRDHPLVSLIADLIDGLAAAVRGIDDGRRRGAPRSMIVEAGHDVPAFTLGRRNIVAELRVAGRRAGSVEVVVGPLGIVSGRALRAALCETLEPTLTRIVVRDLVLGAPLAEGSPLHERARALGAASPSRRVSASG